MLSTSASENSMEQRPNPLFLAYWEHSKGKSRLVAIFSFQQPIFSDSNDAHNPVHSAEWLTMPDDQLARALTATFLNENSYSEHFSASTSSDQVSRQELANIRRHYQPQVEEGIMHLLTAISNNYHSTLQEAIYNDETLKRCANKLESQYEVQAPKLRKNWTDFLKKEWQDTQQKRKEIEQTRSNVRKMMAEQRRGSQVSQFNTRDEEVNKTKKKEQRHHSVFGLQFGATYIPRSVVNDQSLVQQLPQSRPSQEGSFLASRSEKKERVRQAELEQKDSPPKMSRKASYRKMKVMEDCTE